MVYVGCSHAATHIPSLAPIFRKVFTDSVGIESPKSFLRLLASKLVFPDTRSAILSCFLIYFFRILERRSGSLKFSSHLAVRSYTPLSLINTLNCHFSLVSWLLGLSLDLVLSPFLPLAWAPLLTPGPLSLVLPLFVPYFSSIPPVSR